MKWFGEKVYAPICEEIPRVPAPVGVPCACCEEPIAAGDDGFVVPVVGHARKGELPWHVECHVRSIFGGINHLRGLCTCCGGTKDPDPPDVSRRAAARLAMDYINRGGRRT